MLGKNIDNNKINQLFKNSLVLNQNNQQVSLDKTKIDINQIPSFVFEHLDLSLLYLNDAISKGFITPNIVNQEVQLNYHGINQSNYLNTDNNIIEFNDSSKNKNLQSEMPQIWFSTYGPSHWWRFWEWGAYVHLDHNAVFLLTICKNNCWNIKCCLFI